MFEFGKSSLRRKATLHPIIQVLCHRVIRVYDFSILCGWRSEAKQLEAYNEGNSKVLFPFSKHNRSLLLGLPNVSDAIDAGPWINGRTSEDYSDCSHMAGMFIMAAESFHLEDMGLELVWGGNWDGDMEIITDQNFNDLYHLELRKIT
jgi:peptidoglycan LD-endopeptidase CwlK